MHQEIIKIIKKINIAKAKDRGQLVQELMLELEQLNTYDNFIQDGPENNTINTSVLIESSAIALPQNLVEKIIYSSENFTKKNTFGYNAIMAYIRKYAYSDRKEAYLLEAIDHMLENSPGITADDLGLDEVTYLYFDDINILEVLSKYGLINIEIFKILTNAYTFESIQNLDSWEYVFNKLLVKHDEKTYTAIDEVIKNSKNDALREKFEAYKKSAKVQPLKSLCIDDLVNSSQFNPSRKKQLVKEYMKPSAPGKL